MNPVLRYTSKDFDSILQEMKAQIPVLAPGLTNLNEGEPAMALVRLMAGIGDMLAFYLDRNAEEVFLPTARTRQALQNLTRLIDYRLSRPVAAKTTLRFFLDEPAAENIRIPAYTEVKTEAGLYFATREEVTLYAGTTSVEVEGYQGKLHRESFTGTGEDVQYFRLSQPKVAENFLHVRVGSSLWQEDSFDSPPTALSVYEVNADVNDFATLRFSRFLGSVPSQNSTVAVTYLATEGEKGNVGSGVVNSIVSVIPGGSALKVTNVTMASGGKDRESADEARMNAPRRLRALGRAVTLQDFEDLLMTFPKVAKAKAINHNGYAEIYVAPVGGGNLFVPSPSDFTTDVLTTGGSLTPDTYYVQVTYIDENGGETTSWEYNPADRAVVDKYRTVVVSDVGGESQIIVTRGTLPEGVTGWAVYCGTSPATMLRVGEVQDAEATELAIMAVPVGTKLCPAKNTTGVRSETGARSLKEEAEEYLEQRRLIGTVFALFNAVYVPVDITATVRIYDNYRQDDVQGAVETALRDLFSFENQEFGEAVYISDLYEAVMQVPGVRSVSFAAPANDIELEDGEIATLGSVTFTMQGGVMSA